MCLIVCFLLFCFFFFFFFLALNITLMDLNSTSFVITTKNPQQPPEDTLRKHFIMVLWICEINFDVNI